jgi:hypothetical protein
MKLYRIGAIRCRIPIGPVTCYFESEIVARVDWQGKTKTRPPKIGRIRQLRAPAAPRRRGGVGNRTWCFSFRGAGGNANLPMRPDDRLGNAETGPGTALFGAQAIDADPRMCLGPLRSP